MSALPIVDAVTALLIHDGEIYVTLRNPALPAFPGYHAFPGGKVDPEDAVGDALPAELDAFDTRLTRALVRELREEVGFDLIDAVAGGEVMELREVGRALTPPTVARRYDTRFFRIVLKHRPALVLDRRESVSGEWASPRQWVERYRRGDLLVAPPTLACLQSLALEPDADTIEGLQMERLRAVIASGHQNVYGLRQLFVPSNTLPPAQHTNCFVIGDEHGRRIAVDPSPRDAQELDKLSGLLAELGVGELFLTHHHPDHREGADELARRHGWALGMSRDTEARIRAKAPATFFEGVRLRHYAEGDVVTQWLGHSVRALEVPGHDEGQLALMPDNAAWCIVGDLIQGVGTVVIAEPEGHMGRYFRSLERVIALAPRVIVPSHGMAMGTTHRLEETLRHRRMREQQILEAVAAGLDIEQMLEKLYRGTDARLMPYARKNILSHLQKLREEGRMAA